MQNFIHDCSGENHFLGEINFKRKQIWRMFITVKF